MVRDFLISALCAISKEAFYIIVFGAVLAGFIACLFISIFKSGYGLKRRVWYLVLLAFFCAVSNFRANALGEAEYSPLLCAFGLLLFLPVYFIREKRKAKTDDRANREFVRFIESKMRNANEGDSVNFQKKPPDEPKTEILTAKPRAEEKECDLDFSHVKNVLKRLEPTSLSYADRKQIHDLEVALYSAEHGEKSNDTKTKINEGLGNLLKIMAKHGI